MQRIHRIGDKFVADTPDVRATVDTAQAIERAATTHDTTVTAVVTRGDTAITTHINSDVVDSLGALVTLTCDLATTMHTTPHHINDKTRAVLDELEDADE